MSGIRKNEHGMASILVTMIMIIVISLIVLGFAQVARRNQREALDDQLSTQAYYAAESGVNAAANYLSLNPTYSTNTTGNCQSFISTLGTGQNKISTSPEVEYTCLMVNPQPSSLTLAPLTENADTVMHIEDAAGLPFQKLSFHWTEQTNSDFPDTNSANNCTSAQNGAFPAYSQWKCSYGILRLDIVDGAGASISNASLENDQTVTSLYLIPSYKTGSPYTSEVAMSGNPDAQPITPRSGLSAACSSSSNCPVRTIPVSCTASGGCTLTLDISGATDEYYARMSMMYQSAASVSITAQDSSSSLGNVKFIGGQAVIDSTGQSEDELRRIQVRVPLVSVESNPTYALQTTDSICKRLTVLNTSPGSAATDNCTDR